MRFCAKGSTPCSPATLTPARRSCATTSRRRSVSRSSARRPAHRRKASSACSARAAIRRRATSSASSATFRSRPASSCMLRRGQVETGKHRRKMISSRSQLDRAQALLRRFEQEEQLLPQEAERLISEILRACGYEVTDQGFIEGDTGVDCHFQTETDGRRQRIAVEIKFTQRPLSVSESIEQAAHLKQHWMFDRAIV